MPKEQSDNALPSLVPVQVESPKRVDRVEDVDVYQSTPNIVVKQDTLSTDTSPNLDGLSGADVEIEATGRRRLMNVFDRLSSDAETNYSLLNSERIRRSKRRGTSEDTVRRRSTRKSSSAIETEEAKMPHTFRFLQKGQGSKSIYDVQKAVIKDRQPFYKQNRRRSSRSASATEKNIPDLSVNAEKCRASKYSTTDLEIPKKNTVKSVDVRQRVEAIAARGLSHDGTSSQPSLSRRHSTFGPIRTADIGVQDHYHNIEVPYHIDSRSAFGRRKSQDFGFPGARIKSHTTSRSHKPLQGPRNWIKRACGHFSYTEHGEAQVQAQSRSCQQCSAKFPPQPIPHALQQHRGGRRAVSKSATSTSSSSKRSVSGRGHKSRRRQRYSKCIESDKCGDTFARDLGYIIDSILEEHTNTLQGVINNIRRSQTSPVQLRRVSGDVVQRRQIGGVCTSPSYTPRRPQFIQPMVQQPYHPCQTIQKHIYQPVYRSQACERIPPCPYVPLRAVEKLNVGTTGQIGPNINDPGISLRKAVKTVAELVDLVNSVADDLGVDLGKRPSMKDDEDFHNAPYEKMPRASVASRDNAEAPAEVTWPQQTRRHLTDLLEARTQLMDEIDTIAEVTGIQLQGRYMLSKDSNALSRQSTRLRNKSVDSVAEAVTKMTDQQVEKRLLGRVLTRISSQSRQTSVVSQNLQQVDVPQCGPQYAPQHEPEYEFDSESQFGHDTMFEPVLSDDCPTITPQRRCTTPISELQDGIVDLKRLLRKELKREHSSEEAGVFAIPVERATASAGVSVAPPVQSMAYDEPERDLERNFNGKEMTRQVVLPPSRNAATRIKSPLVSQEPTLQQEGTFFVDLCGTSEHEKPIRQLQHKLNKVETDMLPRQPTRRRTSSVASAVQFEQPQKSS